MTNIQNDQDFGYALLKAIQERRDRKEDIPLMNVLASVVRAALGLKEPEPYAVPMPPPQMKVPKEFPCWRVKYSPAGEELARKFCRNLDEVGVLLRSDPQFSYWLPVEDLAPEPSGPIQKDDRRRD